MVTGQDHGELPFDLSVYDKAFTRKGVIGTCQSLSVTPRHNQQPTAALVLPGTHPQVKNLTPQGARVVIRMGPNKDFLMSGRVDSYAVAGPKAQTTYTFEVLDDWQLLARMLAWPVPGAAIGAQGAAEYDVRTGPAETVLKAVVAANKGHANTNVTVAPDLARGSVIPVSNRFHDLTERLMPAVDTAGIGVTVRQSGAGFVLDCYPVRTWPRTLTEDSQVVQEWRITTAAPKATRVIVGGRDAVSGDGKTRVFRSRVNTAAEALYGYSIEAFLDATDTTTAAEMDARGDQFLLENGPTGGISVRLADTANFHYDPTGVNGVRVGDLITFEVGNGQTFTDVLREATLTWSPDNGVTVTPQVGERTGDLGAQVASLLTAFRRSLNNIRS